MLDGLDKVDWPQLTHAFGPATDVPKLLRLLLSEDEKTRAGAFHELCGNIWHQGSVYEATAYAAPFLYELVANPTVKDRRLSAVLLGMIARGHSYHEVNEPSSKAQIERELIWVQNAKDAVRKQLDASIPLLKANDSKLRLAIAHLLACFPEEAARTKPALITALAVETDVGARAVLGLALAFLGDRHTEAFTAASKCPLPLARISTLADFVTSGKVNREDALDVLSDLATDSFEEESLDDLGISQEP